MVAIDFSIPSVWQILANTVKTKKEAAAFYDNGLRGEGTILLALHVEDS
ncbi:hypothetical protein GGD81_004182 [Rhodobium orientis]|nr:hypothetical protein [Rhodobium orientis]MBB4305114.1 hypothetical protein [Rhodobium orientis]